MHLSATHHLNARPEAVARMLADPAYLRHKTAQTGASPDQIDVSGDAAGEFTVTLRRLLPTEDIPAQVRGFVGNQLEVRQVEVWEAAGPQERRATVVVEIVGAPVRLTGTAVLADGAGGGSVLSYEGEVKASVPLFGGAIEKAATTALLRALDAEARAAADWLAGSAGSSGTTESSGTAGSTDHPGPTDHPGSAGPGQV